jgi:hypothetical protein
MAERVKLTPRAKKKVTLTPRPSARDVSGRATLVSQRPGVEPIGPAGKPGTQLTRSGQRFADLLNMPYGTEQELQSLEDAVGKMKVEGPPDGLSIEDFRMLTNQPSWIQRNLGGEAGFEGAGGALGGILGSRAGAGGAAIGGVGGAVAGRSLYETAQEISNLVDFPNYQGRTLEQGLRKGAAGALEAGTAEGAANLVVRAGGPVLSSGLKAIGRMTGLNTGPRRLPSGEKIPEGRRYKPQIEAQKTAKLEGIPYGGMHTRLGFFNISSKAAGVLPIIGGPIKKNVEKSMQATSDQFMSMLNDISPVRALVDLGTKIGSKAAGRVGESRRVVAHLYADMNAAFKAMGDPEVVPMARQARDGELLPRDIAQAAVRDLQNLPTTAKGGKIQFSANEEFEKALNALANASDYITPTQFRALQKDLNRAAAKLGRDKGPEFKILSDIQTAARQSLREISPERLRQLGVDEEAAETILSKVTRANEAHSTLMDEISTTAAKRLTRVDRNIFQWGYAKKGNINIDELADDLVGSSSVLRSRIFIDDLEGLIGVENRKALARKVIQRAAKLQQVETQAGAQFKHFDPAALETALGLTGGDYGSIKANRQALSRLLEGTGITVGRLEAFLDVAKRVQATETGMSTTSAFLARRVTLGGSIMPSVIGGAATAGAASAGVVSFGTFIIAGRQFSKLVSSPGGLEVLTNGLKARPTTANLALMAYRINRLINEDAELRDQSGKLIEPRGPLIGQTKMVVRQ